MQDFCELKRKKEADRGCALSSTTIFERAVVPRKGENTGINCIGRFTKDSSFPVVIAR